MMRQAGDVTGTVMSQAGGDVSTGFGARERKSPCAEACIAHHSDRVVIL